RQAAAGDAAHAHAPRGALQMADGGVPAHEAVRPLPPRRALVLPVDGPRPGAGRGRAADPGGDDRARAGRPRRRSLRRDADHVRRLHRSRAGASERAVVPPADLSPPVAARLTAVIVQHGLPPTAVGPLAALLRVLDADEHAPTTVRAPAQAVDVHVADSLAGLELDAVRSATRIADLGAGAGFPGVPLAVALPGSRVTRVESIARKCAFIRAAADAAGIGNAEAVAERAEAWPAGIGAHDLVTARALAPLAVLAEYAAPLLREDG